LLTTGALSGIETLIEAGVPFDRDSAGAFALGREAAHSRRRILHAGGDATGRAILEALVRATRAQANVRVLEDADARALLTGGDGSIRGVLAEIGGERVSLGARAVVL